MTEALIAFYGDDFTGSTDALAQYHRVGLPGVLLIDASDGTLARFAGEDVAVVGVAGISRSLNRENLRREVTGKLSWLARLRPTFVQYKLCSTFDSSPGIGNLGEVVGLGRHLFGTAPVPVMPAQPEFGRFTAFGNHFAREGTAVHRLDRHPTMAAHPTTPMREADLRLELARQAELAVGSLTLEDIRQTPGELDARLGQLAGFDAVVLDAVSNDDIVAVGQLLWERAAGSTMFGMGSGGLSFGVGQHLAAQGLNRGPQDAARVEGVDRLLVLSGSLAPQTKRQLAHAEEQGWQRVPLHPGELLEPDDAARERGRVITEVVAAFRDARGVAVDSSPTGTVDAVVSPDQYPGGLAQLLGRELAEVLRSVLAEVSLPRIVIAGGDTSGHTLSALGVEALTITRRMGVAATLCQAWSSTDPLVDGLEMILKGGQVGDDRFFETALRGTGASAPGAVRPVSHDRTSPRHGRYR